VDNPGGYSGDTFLLLCWYFDFLLFDWGHYFTDFQRHCLPAGDEYLLNIIETLNYV
jgi:hypothetical protein